jgi:tRNA threonylcarbamoyl adenosine modification protein YeaZ
MTAASAGGFQAGDRPWLALVTCGPHMEVALGAPFLAVDSVVRLGGVTPRSTLVLAAVDLLVEDAGVTPADLGLIVVSRGPGSFTGIRAGLATAMGLAAATGAGCVAYDSLLMLAARCSAPGTVWAAQPGRRSEVYARRFEVEGGGPPVGSGSIEILPIGGIGRRGPWVAAESLELGRNDTAAVDCGSAEALLRLCRLGVPSDPVEPLYVEGPPIHGHEPGV